MFLLFPNMNYVYSHFLRWYVSDNVYAGQYLETKIIPLHNLKENHDSCKALCKAASQGTAAIIIL